MKSPFNTPANPTMFIDLTRKKLSLFIMLGASILILFTTSQISAQSVNVTFQVDLDGLDTSSGVYVGSDWAGWDLPLFQAMTDENLDGIFEITIALPMGASYNYRYTLGNYDWNNFEDLSSGTCGAGPKKQDRNIVVPTQDAILDVYCFSLCTDCSSTIKTYLNLSLNMGQTEVSSDGIHVTGSFNGWNTNSLKLTDENNDNIYEIAIRVSPNKTYEYKFLNGSTWGTEEHVYGTCEFRSNRLVTVKANDLTQATVLFGYCENEELPIQDIKIGCVGNSITHGYGTSDMFTKCWPFQLRDLLGQGYYAENLGVSGATMLKTSDLSWWDQPQYDYIFELQPNIIVIKLGTNDSKGFNWNAARYKADYIDMIQKFKTMDSDPTIYMMAPAKAYSSIWSISNTTIVNDIIPILKEISFEHAVNLIDMYHASLNMSTNFPDGVHPNDAGAAVIAHKVKENILHEKPVISPVEVVEKVMPHPFYQWFLDDQPIENGQAQTINVSKAGHYRVAVKLADDKDDIYVSEPYELLLSDIEKGSLALTTNVSIPTGINKGLGMINPMIYPNPARENIYVGHAAQSNIEIFNTSGQSVLSRENISNEEEINISALKEGLYFLRLSNENAMKTHKILIEK